MHKFLFPWIHGPDHDLCIRAIGYLVSCLRWAMENILVVWKRHKFFFWNTWLGHQTNLSVGKIFFGIPGWATKQICLLKKLSVTIYNVGKKP